tara:strand:- start:912 stop:1286 length:375 start_codon:yes stop_codon:yes gene_type:complete
MNFKLGLAGLVIAGCSYPGLRDTTVLDAPSDSTFTPSQPIYNPTLDPLNPLSPFCILQTPQLTPPQPTFQLPSPPPQLIRPIIQPPIYPNQTYSPPNITIPQFNIPQGNLMQVRNPYDQTTPRP